LKRSENARTRATAHGLDKYAVAVVVIDYQHVIVAGAGGDDELAGLVGVDLA
jgi:hypothetical protein